MRKFFLLTGLFIIGSYLFAQTGRELEFQKWALTPPMGWNSWDCFGPTVVESEVKANADYMAEKLKPYGWEYIVVDIRWYVENDKAGGYNQTNPVYCMDEWGRYTPATNRFPSAENGAGFKPLADYIHSKGLKFGIHIMRGVPKKAVEQRLPIKNGNGKTVADIYSTNLQCTWLRDNYTILANKEGAQEYYNSIFELYAAWGVDFIKIDDLSRPYHQDEIEMIRKAIDRTGRPIVLSTSPGETPVDKAGHIKTHANMWRTVDDFWDSWDHLLYQFTVCHRWEEHISPGTWPDADMLPLGRIGIRAERGSDRMTNFTKDEQYTLMSLWSMFKSPLMFGGHLPSNDVFTDSLITNEEVLYINQRSVNNKQYSNDGELAVWIADDPDNGDKFAAMFNLANNGFIETRDVLYRSGIISNLTDGHGVTIDIDIPEGSRDLFLIVTDAGDGYDGDHADWINPVLYNENGDELKLTDLTWETATAGWGTVTKNKSVGGGNLVVNGTTYTEGIGTHANSVIHYQLPEGYTKFKAFAGLDYSGISQYLGTTVEFMIFNEDPTLRDVNVKNAVANTGRISRTKQREGVNIEADITGAAKLYLVVTDAGDNFNYDHADWINPLLSKEDGATLDLTTLNWVKATSGWDEVKKNKSLDNNPLTVNAQTYPKGFGVNSYSIIEFDLPQEGYTKFTAFCGFDDEVLNVSDGVSVEFMVFTTDPAAFPEESFPLDMDGIGFKGECTVRDLWKGEDLGTFSGNSFAPVINQHGVGLYRVSAINRSAATTVSLSPVFIDTNEGDTILLNVSVVADGEEVPTGSVLIMQDGAVAGVLSLDDEAKAAYTATSLLKGNYTFHAKYSGNTIYQSQLSNSVQVTVEREEASVNKPEVSKIKLVSFKNEKYLQGLQAGDEITLYNSIGQILSVFKARSDMEPIQQSNTAVIKIKSGNDYTVLKTIL